MSAPSTNTDTQIDRHRVPLIGIGLAVVFAFALMFILSGWLGSEDDTPEGAALQVQGNSAISTEN